jgi:glycosyltransferase involved in cell wall biosynthesis
MTNSPKPRILIIVDRPGWAHDHKTGNLQRMLSGKYEIIKKYQSEVDESDLQEADLIQFYYWLQLQRLPHLELVLNQNLHKLLIGVCGLVELQNELLEPGLAWLSKAIVVFVNNQLLYNELRSVLNLPVLYTPNGVDTSFFSPPNSRHRHDKLRVGWSGSLNNHGSEHRGFDNLILPALRAMEGVELVTAIREDHWRTHEEMIDFYQSLDVYICASVSEGTPNTCLEAAACGVPLVTTRVGNMPELIKPGINGYFIDRDISDIIKVLTILRDHDEHRNQLGQAIRASALDWDWSLRSENYDHLYQFALTSARWRSFKRLLGVDGQWHELKKKIKRIYAYFAH